jgi:GDP-L-fucose synthase
MHCAGKTGGMRSVAADPSTFFWDNALMDLEVFRAAYSAGVEKLVSIGTVCSYPNDAAVPLREETLWDGYPEEPTAPYGLAKRMILVQADAYATQYGFSSAHPILVNTYGPGDKSDGEHARVIPTLVKKFLTAIQEHAPSVSFWGNGLQRREFLYVDDAAALLTLIAERQIDHRPMNIGSGEDASIRELAEMIASEVGYEGSILWDSSASSGKQERSVDLTRMKTAFGDFRHTPLRDGIRQTVAWYKQFSHSVTI